MNARKWIHYVALPVLAVVLAVLAINFVKRPANAGPEPRRFNRQLSREELDKLPPAQREARLRQYRERMEFRLEELRCLQSLGMISVDEEQQIPRLEESIKRASQPSKPEIKPAAGVVKAAATNTQASAREALKNLTPEERQARLKEMRATMEQRAAELRKKQAEGTLTDQEKQRLAKLEENLQKPGPRQPGAAPK